MKTGWIIAILVAAVVALLLFPVMVKNGLIDKQENMIEAWSQIDTQLQRRADLVPNLVATVKGYASHEEKIFLEVAEARSRLLAAGSPEAKAQASSFMSGALGRLLAISENYPQLKADSTFIRLQDELAGTENRISVARTRYNNAVKIYNSAIRKFPGNLFAPGMEMEKAEYYEPPSLESLQTPPEVKF
ncbi:MAG: LemA family protein [Lentisphaerae bacterium]|nr:LemA family protein [Lentisphaerota bacterium]